MDIEEDRPVLRPVLNPTLHFIGFGIAFEVDDITAVFLRGQNLLDCGMPPFCGLHGAFGTALANSLAGSIGRGVQRPHVSQRRGNLQRPVALQGQTINAAHHLGGLRVNHPKPGIVRVLYVAVGRRRKRNPGVALHLVDDPALLRDVLGVVFIHNVLERGKIIFTLVAVHAIGNGHQTHINVYRSVTQSYSKVSINPSR